MSTQFFMRSTVHRVYLTLLFGVTALLAANPLNAGIILVGTISGGGPDAVDTVANVNGLITSYNEDFNANLSLVNFRVNKLEQAEPSPGAPDFWTDGDWSNDFNFFKVTNEVTEKQLNIFGTEVNFTPIASTGIIATDENVLGFEHTGNQQFEYYVSKNAGSFSLWTFSSPEALHPVYADRTGDNRGLISSNNDLSYDPLQRGVSHISFYSAVPEPTALVLVSFAMIGFSSLRRRKA